MKQQEALQEARRRWGNDADAWHNQIHNSYVLAPSSKTELFDRFSGDSWEAAFANADSRERAYADQKEA